MKKTALFVIAMIALIALPLCASVQAAEKTLTIGGIIFLSGPASPGGIATSRGWQIAVDKFNNAGGLKIGNDTYKVNLILEDDSMSPDQAATAATKLIKKDGAKIIIGPMIDALRTVVYPITSKNGVLMILGSVNASGALPFDSNADVSPKKPLLIRTAYAFNEATPHLLDYLKERYPSVKTIAVCGVVEKSLEMLYDDCKGQFERKGFRRVGTLEQFAPDVQDFGPVMARVLQSKPDAIYMAISTPVTYGMSVKAAREQGFKGPIFCATHQDIAFQAMLAGKGNDTDMFGIGTTLADRASLSPAFKNAIEELEALYAKRYPPKDFNADTFTAGGYHGLLVLLQTIAKAQTLDMDKVVKTYESLSKKGDVQTVWGPAYTGGKKSLGVNRALCYPFTIDATVNGVSKNVKTIFFNVP
jgi:branched-chain amino acid transport system substrate-binding protein